MKGNRLLSLLIIIIFVSVAAAGCNGISTDEDSQKPPDAGEEQKMIEQNISLYFSDDQAMYLVPEERIVKVNLDNKDEEIRNAVINELISGPEEPDLYPTIPAETKLLGITVKDDTAYVDFSEEIRSKHWGGSTGEIMTVGSIINSLTELDGIEKVLILINGETQETLVGHLEISEPSGRIESLMK